MITSTQNASLSSSTQNPAQVEKEVRFAVVMYGGVSLAVYINGVTQELLHMVRSTAVSTSLGQKLQIPYEELRRRPTEAVYRKVSYLLSEAASDRASSTDQSQAAEIAAAELNKAKNQLRTDVPIPVKLVVDIIAGTSAGGINGIFLAKALANNQDIRQLQELWVEEGDIGKLINDRRSILSPLVETHPPASLLNSQRMYLKLLNAFMEMKTPPGYPAPETPNAPPSPYVEELDLFVTATDLLGVKLPLQLADRVIYERRYRNVFHFMYAYKYDSAEVMRNDFLADNDPFLAYAARCTASFPFAFEPMSLEDIDFLIDHLDQYRDKANFRAGAERWRKFFKKYVPDKFPSRPFGDGGYLDNKPFTYATDTITRRSAEVPVERKLVYIEPSPDHPEEEDDVFAKPDGKLTEEDDKLAGEGDKLVKPDALGNTLAALLTLPRAETIREDLQRVIERNRTIERVNRILYGIERDAERANRSIGDVRLDPARKDSILKRINGGVTNGASHKNLDDDDTWAKLDLSEMLLIKGFGYLAYHRLDIASVTDSLALLIIPSDFDEDSDLLIAVRCIIRAWREMTYTDYKERSDGSEDARPTMNEFLWSFNLLYPLRRLNFLRAKIDQLYKLDQQALDTLRFYALKLVPEELKPYVSKEKDAKDLAGDGLEQKAIREALREELRSIKVKINITYLQLRRCGHDLKAIPEKAQAGGGNADGRANATPTGQAITKKDLFHILGQGEDSTMDGESDRAGDPVPTSLEPAPPMKVAGETLTSQEEAVRRAKRLLEKDGYYDWVNGVAQAVADGVKSARHVAHEDCKGYLRIGLEKEEASYSSAIRATLRHYYMHYDDYDMLTFPILYNSGVGEASYVEVVRFSPDDATALLDEMNLPAGEVAQPKDGKKPEPFKCSKLAGEAFGHFGAFLNRQWRMNDILWGRLDGAERIIRTLLPDRPNEAAQLIGEAQAAIVCEMIAELCGVTEVSELATHHFTLREREGIYGMLIEGFMHPRPRQKQEEREPVKVKEALSAALRRFAVALHCGAKGTEWEVPLNNAIDKAELLEYFDEQYKWAGGLFKRLSLVKRLGILNTWRSTRTLGGIFGGILRLRLRRGQATDKNKG